MTTQTLLCWKGHEWERTRKRGSLPKSCPEHARERQRAYDKGQNKRYYERVTGTGVAERIASLPETQDLQCAGGHPWSRPRVPGLPPERCPEHKAAHDRRLNAARRAKRRKSKPELIKREKAESYARNAETVRARSRASYAANPARALATKAAYRKSEAGKEAKARSSAKRRARALGAPTIDGAVSWRTVAARDGMECAYCHVVCNPEDRSPLVKTNGTPGWSFGPTYPTLDHVIPLSKGGAHTMDNCVLACWTCNTSKKDLMPAEFARV